eukprot:10537060-Heterocapsa_arctica.AAC.1
MVMRNFIVCDAQEFQNEFGWSHNDVEGVTVIDGLLNQEGSCVPGILLKDPEQPFRKLKVYSQASNAMDTHMLMPESYHRDGQGTEAYDRLRQEVLGSRHPSLRNGMKILSVREVHAKTMNTKEAAQEKARKDADKLLRWEARRKAAMARGESEAEDEDSSQEEESDDDKDGV